MSDDQTPEAYEAVFKALWKHRDEKADLITACDAALDWADQNARAFTIETAPESARFSVWCEHSKNWFTMNGRLHLEELKDNPVYNFTHWRHLPPPPSNPPLPAPLEALGEVLRRVKGVE